MEMEIWHKYDLNCERGPAMNTWRSATQRQRSKRKTTKRREGENSCSGYRALIRRRIIRNKIVKIHIVILLSFLIFHQSSTLICRQPSTLLKVVAHKGNNFLLVKGNELPCGITKDFPQHSLRGPSKGQKEDLSPLIELPVTNPFGVTGREAPKNDAKDHVMSGEAITARVEVASKKWTQSREQRQK